MEQLRKLRRWIGATRLPSTATVLTPEQELAQQLKPYEYYLYKIQAIAAWDEPTESLLTLFLVNAVFWVLSYFHWRFFGLFFAIAFLVIAHEVWTNHIWPEISLPTPPGKAKRPATLPVPPVTEGVLTVSEISRYATGFRAAVSDLYARLMLLRQTRPQAYCGAIAAGCLVTASLSSIVSATTQIYLMAMAAFTIPGFVKHVLSASTKQQILEAVKTASVIFAPSEAVPEEYLPDVTTREAVVALSQAGENNDLSPPSTSDSSLGDLLMPGYDESSVDGFDSLLPTIPQESSRESSDSEGNLRFRPTHFNGSSMAAHDDSTDEESSLIKDLDFPEVGPTSGGLKDAVASALYRTFPKVFTPAKPVFNRVENEDSDSDFEIIDTEDAS